jgi:hypothetical protein
VLNAQTKLDNNDSWAVILPMAIMALANPLKEFFGIPALFTNSIAGFLLLAWFVFYALRVWRKSFQDKKVFLEKFAAAETQLKN